MTIQSLEMIKYMLQFPGVNINKMMNDSILSSYNLSATIINTAIIKKNNEIIKLIMNEPTFDVNGINDCCCPLHCAIEMENLDAFKMLLEFPGININNTNYGWALCLHKTPLTHAIAKRTKEIIELLLNHPDIDVNGGDYETPLSMACRKGNINVVKRLLSFPQIKVNGNSSSVPLIEACERGHIKIVKLLLSHPEIDINKMGQYNTPLINSIMHKHHEITQILLNYPEIDINKKGGSNMYNGNELSSPLEFACSQNNLDLVKQIVSFPNIDLNPTFSQDIFSKLRTRIRDYLNSIKEKTCITATIDKDEIIS